jgi:hypothetical protein
VSACYLFGLPCTCWWCSKATHDYVYEWPVHSLQNKQNLRAFHWESSFPGLTLWSQSSSKLHLKIQFLWQKRKQCISITKVSCFVLFTEIITVYCKNHANPNNTFYMQNDQFLSLEENDSYSYHCVSEG